MCGSCKLWRLKLGTLAGLLGIDSLDGFAEQFGVKWGYHLRPVLEGLELPYYEDMRMAHLAGWHLKNERGEDWPWPDLTLSAETVRQSHLQAFVLAKDLLLRLSRRRPDQERPRSIRLKSRVTIPARPPLRPAFKSWLEYTSNNN